MRSCSSDIGSGWCCRLHEASSQQDRRPSAILDVLSQRYSCTVIGLHVDAMLGAAEGSLRGREDRCVRLRICGARSEPHQRRFTSLVWTRKCSGVKGSSSRTESQVGRETLKRVA